MSSEAKITPVLCIKAKWTKKEEGSKSCIATLTVSTMSAEALAVKLAELSFTWKGSQQALEVPSEPMVACNSSSVWKRVEAKQRAARAAAKQSREAASGCTSAG